jgi:hypothetical protein
MVRAFFVAIALALGVNPEPAPPPVEQSATPVPDSILAVLFPETGPGSELVSVDPLSLKPSGRRVPLATGGGWATAFSPDQRKLALSGGMGLAAVELVDVRRMRSLGVVDLKMPGTVSLLSWQPLGYLFAVVEDEHERAVVTIDPVGLSVQARHRIAGTILQAKEATGQVVLLLGPPDGIGPLRLAVVGGKGMASAAIPGFVGGWRTDRTGEVVHTREEVPALVIDDDGRRALVFSGRSVADVSLRNLSVTTHALSEPVSLLDRFRNWLEPRAHAKLVEGFWREGTWLGNGRFAVTGMDYAMSTDGEAGAKPFGLALVDTRDWSIRKVAEGGANLVVTEYALLTFSYESDNGIGGYDLRREETFRLLPGAAGGWLQVVNGLVYAQLGDGRRFAVIDPALRRKIGEARVRQPITLIDD